MCLERSELKNIYRHLGDELSRRVFRYRLLYSLFREGDDLAAMIAAGTPGYADARSGKVCYYGAGAGGEWLLACDPSAAFVIDSYRTGTLRGRPILPFEEFLAMPDCREYTVVIAAGKERAKKEIAGSLERQGIRFLFGYPGTQYFDLPQLELRDEYFVDAGALDGGTTRRFLEHFPGGRAYVFEPNPEQFAVTRENLNGLAGAELLPYALSDANAELRFDPHPEDAGNAFISPEGPVHVEARRLDDLLGDRKVTFIKMDIEGSELAALRGAERIIREQTPKLAISVYHKPEDIWEIPELILSYVPGYRLYLRHYSITHTETVLYAIP